MALPRQWRGPPSDVNDGAAPSAILPSRDASAGWMPPVATSQDPQEPVNFSHEPMLLASLKDWLVCRPWLCRDCYRSPTWLTRTLDRAVGSDSKLCPGSSCVAG
jgi:hypothetical protein